MDYLFVNHMLGDSLCLGIEGKMAWYIFWEIYTPNVLYICLNTNLFTLCAPSGACVCTMYKLGAGGGQRGASGPSELELQEVMSRHVVLRSELSHLGVKCSNV